MAKDDDERKRPHLRLVVDNVEKRSARPAAGENNFIVLEELVARREELRVSFYADLERRQAKAYGELELFLATKGWSYGLDPDHGKLMVVPAGVIFPAAAEHGDAIQDELLLHVAEDAAGQGLCLSLEMVLPFWSDDDTLMEEALLFGPIHQYGTHFLEENKGDNYLDLIYRLAFPLYPPALTGKLLEKLFAIAGFELAETLKNLAEYPEG